MKKFSILSWPLLLFVLLFALVLCDLRLNQSLARQRKEKQEEMHILNQEGFYKEALRFYRGLAGPLRAPLAAELFRAYIGSQSLAQAKALLEEQPDLGKNQEAILTLYEAYRKARQPAEAYYFLSSKIKLVDQRIYQEEMEGLFQSYQLLPISFTFYKGWFEGLAIVRDPAGFYLVNAEGIALTQDRYECLEPDEKGFCAKKKDHWVQLDRRGRLSGLRKQGPSTMRRAEDSCVLSVEQGSSHYFFAWQGRAITQEPFTALSPLSSRGVAFAKWQDHWQLLRIPALEKGPFRSRLRRES